MSRRLTRTMSKPGDKLRGFREVGTFSRHDRKAVLVGEFPRGAKIHRHSHPNSPLEHALRQLGSAIERKLLMPEAFRGGRDLLSMGSACNFRRHRCA
jgi:hypothetical protein